ncbi:MAG TPA: hypothetical protein VF093_12000 [Solirubrobacterales bacterium]
MNDAPSQLLISGDQLWVLLIGAIVPVGGYWINKVMPWKTETSKAIVQIVLTSIAATLYTFIATDIGSLTSFVEQAFSAIVAGLFAHNILWKPANVNIKFGANPTPTQAAGLTSKEFTGLDAEQKQAIVVPNN